MRRGLISAGVLAAAGSTDPIAMVLGDAGYWSKDNASSFGPDRPNTSPED